MPASIFISYAQRTSHAEAEALKAHFQSEAFLDQSDIPTREHFTQVIATALMAARIAVVFADDTYFEREYCRWEWSLILSAPKLDHVYVTIAAGATHALDHLPPDLRTRSWPNPAQLPDAIHAHLLKSPLPIGKLIQEQDLEYLLESAYEQSELPPVQTALLAKIPHRWHLQLDESAQSTFVGRAEQLNQLHRQLWLRHMGQASAVAATAAVHGAGGFGKSRLAAEYVHRHAPQHFTGGIFWLQCETSLETQFHEVAQLLDPATPSIQILNQNAVSIPKLLREKVQAAVGQGKPVLFVLDNVPEVEGKLPPLETYCPAKGLASVLITSRQSQGAVSTIHIETLPSTSAWLLLTANLANRATLSRTEWNEITDWVGRLPLALEILNRALVNRARPFAEILRRARRNETTQELDDYAKALPEIPRGATETFEISYRALSAEARHAARLLAELGPEPIPEILMESLEITALQVRTELHGHAFVTDTSGDTFGAMHRVLASFLREKTRLEGEAIEIEQFGKERQKHAAAVRAVKKILEYKLKVSDPQNWERLKNIRPHAEHLAAQSDFGLATFGVCLGNLSRAQGDLLAARQLQQQALDINCRVLGDEHPDTLTSMSNLAGVFWAQGDLLAARQLIQQVLDTRRIVLGGEHPDTLSSMNNLAETLRAQGELADASQLHQQALEIRRRVLGDKHPDTLTSMNNLALTFRAQGDLPATRQLQQQVLDVSRQVLGDDHPNTLTYMNNLAATLWAQGDLPAARQLHQQALDTRRRVLGDEHPDTIQSASHLYRTLSALHDDEKAKQVLTTHLLPLLKKDPATLSAETRQIQTYVGKIAPTGPRS